MGMATVLPDLGVCHTATHRSRDTHAFERTRMTLRTLGIFIACNLRIETRYGTSCSFLSAFNFHIKLCCTASKLLITFISRVHRKKVQFNYEKMSLLIMYIFSAGFTVSEFRRAWSPHGFSCYLHLTFLSSRNI